MLRVLAACGCALIVAAPAMHGQATRQTGAPAEAARVFDVMEQSAADLQRGHGRFLYFAPDEVEPLEVPG
jgi:hypothetical protein